MNHGSLEISELEFKQSKSRITRNSSFPSFSNSLKSSRCRPRRSSSSTKANSKRSNCNRASSTCRKYNTWSISLYRGSSCTCRKYNAWISLLSRSSKVKGHCIKRNPIYDFLYVCNSNQVPILYSYGVI